MLGGGGGEKVSQAHNVSHNVLSYSIRSSTPSHSDYADTEQIMTEKLHNQVNGSEWSWNWKNLNTVNIV